MMILDSGLLLGQPCICMFSHASGGRQSRWIWHCVFIFMSMFMHFRRSISYYWHVHSNHMSIR